MIKYLCRKCDTFIPLDWWEVHHEKCRRKVSWGWVVFWLIVIVGFANLAYGAEMTCSKIHVDGIVRCIASGTEGLDVEWVTIAYGKIEHADFGLQVELPIHGKYYTLIVMNLTSGDGKVSLQSGVWARAQTDGKVEYLKHTKGFDPNKNIPEPRTLQRACIVTVGGLEGNAYYETVIIVGENADEYWVMKEGYDKPVNIPKEKIILAGKFRMIKAANGLSKKCECRV